MPKTIIGEEGTTTIEVVTENYRDGNRYNNRSNCRSEDSNQRYGNRNQDVVDPGIEIEIGEIGVVPGKVPNPGAVIDPKIDMRIGDRAEMIPEIGTGLNQI